MMMERIKLTQITKNYHMENGRVLETLKEINMVLYDKEFVSIIGPSGCGKTTLFRLMTGLDKPDGGEIFVNGQKRRETNEKISYMQQKDLLMPWRTILDNVRLPLEIDKEANPVSPEKMNQLFELFGLKGFEKAYPNTLSGGMRQRAALLRTFMVDSSMMLLDEPFGALDGITRSQMQQWLLDVWQKNQKSVFFITHDIDEAIFLSDRIYVMGGRPGMIVGEIPVDFQRPRTPDLMVTPEYLSYKAEIRNLLTLFPITK